MSVIPTRPLRPGRYVLDADGVLHAWHWQFRLPLPVVAIVTVRPRWASKAQVGRSVCAVEVAAVGSRQAAKPPRNSTATAGLHTEESFSDPAKEPDRVACADVATLHADRLRVLPEPLQKPSQEPLPEPLIVASAGKAPDQPPELRGAAAPVLAETPPPAPYRPGSKIDLSAAPSSMEQAAQGWKDKR